MAFTTLHVVRWAATMTLVPTLAISAYNTLNLEEQTDDLVKKPVPISKQNMEELRKVVKEYAYKQMVLERENTRRRLEQQQQRSQSSA